MSFLHVFVMKHYDQAGLDLVVGAVWIRISVNNGIYFNKGSNRLFSSNIEARYRITNFLKVIVKRFLFYFYYFFLLLRCHLIQI